MGFRLGNHGVIFTFPLKVCQFGSFIVVVVAVFYAATISRTMRVHVPPAHNLIDD
jgi:hypothetical protein